ncbi:DUF4124 domain-containing protein [Pseudomonas matsuisoli]|uniref:DUF4124 domain-containing protein n=1 Tax=Pseudomonas matsuisoli TaxID=1515666 RepID=A0A917UQS7_9PSED|nr:DUF4124 domain-containing protein [Pseudomonas matsuisoli]GGJ78321.1 hypothetical protein GCM10009304_00260 [Pseudomonas matsuisoli]
MVFLRRVIALTCVLAAPVLHAAEINKCVDSKGNVTYTDAACGSGHTLEQRFEPVNPKPGGNDTVRMAPAAAPPAAYVQTQQPPVPAAAPAPAPVQVVPAPQVPESEPNVVYVPTSESRYVRPYGSSRYEERRSYSGYGTSYGNGYGSNSGRGYDRGDHRGDHRPDNRLPPPRPPEKPRPTWRGETEATRALIQGGGGSRGSDRGPGREWRDRN